MDWAGVIIAGAVLNGICQGILLAALVWLVLRTFPRIAAGARHAVWALTLGVIALLPFAQRFVIAAPQAATSGPAAPGGVPELVLHAGTPWLGWALAAVGAIAMLRIARVFWSFAVLERLKARSRSAPEWSQDLLAEVGRALPGRRTARLLISDEVGAPIAAGLRKPAIVLPAFLLDCLSCSELQDVLTHELAHLRRRDDWTNLAQRLIEAVLFFHPAVLWIGRRLTLEREIACDDWVVARTGLARPYAACLTKLAALPAATPQLAPGAVARKPHLSIRVEALLARTRSGRLRTSRAVFAVASAALTVAAIAALPLAPVAVAGVPVPALAAPDAAPAAPAMAFSAPQPAPTPKQVAQVRKPASPRPAAPEPRVEASYEEVAVAAWRGPAIVYVFCIEDGQRGWIRVVWFQSARNPAILGRA